MRSEARPLRVLAHFVPTAKMREYLAAQHDWLDIRYCDPDDDGTFYRELPDAEVIWHVLRPVSGADLEKAPRLRLVHKMGAGLNTVDLDTATRLGIAVANMPGVNAPSVAEGTVLLMLAALRRLPDLDRATREGKGWPTDPTLGDTVREIGACTVGLVGYGHIAKNVERIVASMGAVVVHTSTRADGSTQWLPLTQLLATSDIVSLHLPLTDRTVGMIDRAALATMKPEAVLVNTSRGLLIDEDALADALRSRKLGAAGLDVFALEPVRPDNPLLGVCNVVLSPHITWYTVDTMHRCLVAAIDNCRRIRDGAQLVSVVNQ